jgi:subtilisin family serine protease/flagellar hook assembly protein FlgD
MKNMKLIKLLASSVVASVLVSTPVVRADVSTRVASDDGIPRLNALAEEAAQNYVPHELVVQFRSAASQVEIDRLLQRVGAHVSDKLGVGNFYTITVPSSQSLTSVQSILSQDPLVLSAEPNYRMDQSYTPADDLYRLQWYLPKIEAPKAWNLTKGASDITVAVVDDGVDTSNRELRSKIVHPYDAVTGHTYYTPGDHATHVAGIIAASMDGHGTVGIAPNVRILPVNVFQGNGASNFDVAQGIVYAVDHGADIINLSLGSYMDSDILEYAADYATSHGVLLVAAAGNDDMNLPMYPAALPNVVGVSATDSNDDIAYFSNFGSDIDFSAPGYDIWSTVTGGQYKDLSGTSMAAPVVSGVAALVLSKNPFLTPSQVVSILQKSAKDLGPHGWDQFFGYGRVDAYRAVQDTPSPISSVSSSSSFAMKGNNSLKLSFAASGSTKLSVYIENSHGRVVRRLIENRPWSGGTYTGYWNGMTDNQTQVGSGTYTIVAKATDGKQTLYQRKNVKVTDQSPPQVIVSSKPISFSPDVAHSVKIPFHLTKVAKVTVKVYDTHGKYLTTLWTNKNVGAGNQDVVWNGKDVHGKQVPDGTYRVQFDSVASNHLKGASKSLTVMVDSQLAATLKSGENVFKATGSNQYTSSLQAGEDLNVTAYVVDRKGAKVKSLLANRTVHRGTLTLNWDGKNDKGQDVPEGSYQVVTDVKDAAGNRQTLRSAWFSFEDWRVPTVQAASNVTVNLSTKRPLVVPYTLSKAGQVTIDISQGTTLVAELARDEAKAAGNDSFTWSVKDASGQDIPNGDYTYTISVVDAHNQTAKFSGTIHVNLSSVKIDAPSVVQMDAPFFNDTVAQVYYRLSDPANVSITIVDNQNQLVKTITSNASMSGGIHSFTWDGKDNDGYYAEFLYEQPFKYVIQAVNAGGNTTKVTGVLSTNPKPDWLVSQHVEFVTDPNNSGENKGLTFTANVNQDVTLTLSAYEFPWDSHPVASQTYSLHAGQNVVNFDKPAGYELGLDYTAVYTDQLGNRYTYTFSDSDASNIG